MAGIELTLEELILDQENPRISKASSQREVLQKIIEDQDLKLVVLAESIVGDGLNPMDRWLVLKSPTDRGKYIVLEGNRRLATIKILNNSAVLNDLEVRSPVKKKVRSSGRTVRIEGHPTDRLFRHRRAGSGRQLAEPETHGRK